MSYLESTNLRLMLQIQNLKFHFNASSTFRDIYLHGSMHALGQPCIIENKETTKLVSTVNIVSLHFQEETQCRILVAVS